MQLSTFTEQLYKSVIEKESALSHNAWCIWSLVDAKTIFDITCQLLEYAKNSFVLRSYNIFYNLMDHDGALESVGAHTNLVRAIMDRVLSFLFGPELARSSIPGGYSYREMVEAISRHDLPENQIGDLPDNGNRDNKAKFEAECEYHSKFSKHSPRYEIDFEKNIRKLLLEMEECKTTIGKLLYLSDKVAAIIITLAYDDIGRSPKMRLSNPNATERDLAEMAICDEKEDGACLASEMWTVDYFKVRELEKLDDEGIFTALVVMATLLVKDHWYKWRIHDYATK